MNASLVSIVTPVYNSQKYLLETIRSVQNQTYQNWEIIFIDDFSNDRSVELIESEAIFDDRIRLIQNRSNSGPAVSRNKGIKVAKGSYLTFLDADDIWLPTFLETSITTLEKGNFKFVFSSYKRMDENLKPLYNDFIVPEKVSYSDLLKTCSISCLTAFIKISETGKYYMPEIDKRQDYGLWLKILKDVDFAYGIKTPMAIYRIRKGSVSRNKFKAILYVWRLFREIEKLGRFKAMYYISHYSINGIIKYKS